MASVPGDVQKPSVSQESIDPALQGLLAYCHEHHIYIAPSIGPKRASGRGIGIYAKRNIRQGQRLMFVPTDALITSATVPDTFFSLSEKGVPSPVNGGVIKDGTENTSGCERSNRPSLSLHAKLAAYFTFHTDSLKPHEKWISTWPQWDDFVNGMPVFWGSELENAMSKLQDARHRNDASDEYPSKRRRVQGEQHTDGAIASTEGSNKMGISICPSTSPPFVRSPALDGTWQSTTTPDNSSSVTASSNGEALVTAMVQKITNVICSLMPYFPALASAIHNLNKHDSPDARNSLSSNTAILKRFLHMWSVVNSRCFYYHSPDSCHPPPSDPNECMALCPGMDLFNHSTDPRNCHVKYDKKGFTVTAQRDYKVGEEILLSYGSHSNDVLWMEYGFFLADNNDNEDAVNLNQCDEVPLDALLLPNLTEEERNLLEQHGYLGGYVLRASSDAVNYGNSNDSENKDENDTSSSSVAVGSVCHRTKILSALKALDRKHFHEMVSGKLDPDTLNVDETNALHLQVCKWMGQVMAAADQNISVLRGLNDEELLLWLGGSVLDGRGANDSHDEIKMKSLERLGTANMRKDMCVKRWGQIERLARGVLLQYS